jgi:Holliday junction resolvase
MSYRRFAASRGRQDANASAIIKALKACGVSVVDLHAVGAGVPDVLCGYQGRSVLMEIKAREKATNASVRERQETFAREWKGSPVVTVRSEADALLAIGITLNI